MINDLDISSLAEEYKKNKKVVIKNFLKEEAAQSLHSFLDYGMPEDWWFTAVLVGGKDSGYDSKPQHIRRFKERVQEANEITFAAMDTFAQNFFSYSFDRTLNHADKCDCLLCNYVEEMHSENTLNVLNQITAETLTETKEFFASRYRQLQFLAPHHDTNKGKVGTVYSLSKNWKPQWGGNLHFMENDYKTIKEMIVPSFNTLVLFDIPSQGGVPHFVSQVATRVANKRISITGWLI